jgi:hypothetical protein
MPSMAIKEMQIKTMLKFYLTSVRIAIIKNTTNSHSGKQYGGSLKKLKIGLPYHPAMQCLEIYT